MGIHDLSVELTEGNGMSPPTDGRDASPEISGSDTSGAAANTSPGTSGTSIAVSTFGACMQQSVDESQRKHVSSSVQLNIYTSYIYI